MQRLIERGNWKGSIQRIRMCLDNGCVTLPRQVLSLKDMSFCDRAIPIRNQWWEYLPNGDGVMHASNCGSTCAASCPGTQAIDRGFHPTFSDVRAPNKRLRIYVQLASDYGKRMLIQGYDSNNDFIRTIDDSVNVDGIWLTFTDPYVDLPFDISSITGIQKDVTNGDVLLYEIDTITGLQRLIGRYEPSETVAQYHRYLITDFGNTGSGCCTNESTRTITALAKLDFIPVSVPTDYLFIDNIPAIKEMCQSIRFSEMDTAQAQAQALIHEKKAIRELNHQKQNLNGDDQVAVIQRVYGSAALWKKSIGRLK